MGYDTTIMIRNDALDQIENDPHFGRTLANAVRQMSVLDQPIDIPAGNHANAAQVIETHHSGYTVIVAVGGGHGSVQAQAYGYRHTDERFKRELIERWAEELGLQVVDSTPAPSSKGDPSP